MAGNAGKIIQRADRTSRRRVITGISAAAFASFACEAGGKPRQKAEATDHESLGALAAARGVRLGTAITWSAIDDPGYGALCVQQSRMLTDEHGTSFHYLRRTPGPADYSHGDAMLAFARRYALPLQGHALIWDYEQPDWLKRLNKTEAEVVFDRHIDETLGHFQGYDSWVVVNEPFWPDFGLPGGYREGVWHSTLGPDYVERAFRRAAAVVPRSVKLILNEAQCERFDELGERFRPLLLALLDRLLAKGVRIDAIGLQGHLQLHVPFHADRFSAFLTELARRGVEIHLTEIDINDVQASRRTAERDAAVAERYRQYFAAALSVPAVKVACFWQLGDKYSWYRDEWYLKQAPREHRRWPARPLPYDAELARKPAWTAIADALRTAAR